MVAPQSVTAFVADVPEPDAAMERQRRNLLVRPRAGSAGDVQMRSVPFDSEGCFIPQLNPFGRGFTAVHSSRPAASLEGSQIKAKALQGDSSRNRAFQMPRPRDVRVPDRCFSSPDQHVPPPNTRPQPPAPLPPHQSQEPAFSLSGRRRTSVWKQHELARMATLSALDRLEEEMNATMAAISQRVDELVPKQGQATVDSVSPSDDESAQKHQADVERRKRMKNLSQRKVRALRRGHVEQARDLEREQLRFIVRRHGGRGLIPLADAKEDREEGPEDS